MFTLLQDWTTLQGTGAISFSQSAPKWLCLEAYRDVIFWLEVSALTTVSTELYMNYETAPIADADLFTPMVSEVLMAASATPVVTKVLLSQNPTCPLAGFVRWRIRANAAAAWRVTFRIHGLGKWKG